MSDAVDAVGGILGGIGDAISGAVKAVGSVISGIGNAVVSVVSSIGNTVKNILKDPLPTILQIAGASVGIPPYVTAAVITASRGGGLEDIAKSAAVSYIASEAMSSTNIGSEISKVTNSAGKDFTNYMMENYSLPADAAVSIAKAATASLNSSIVGGLNAAITGKNVGEGMLSGFTSGLVYSSTNSYFDSLNKDPNWGFSDKALNLMKGATSTALNTIISGKGDPAQALGNYIAYATINMGGTTLAKDAKDAYVKLTTDTEAAQKAQEKYTLAKADVDAKVAEGEKLRTEITTEATALNKRIEEEYTPVKNQLDEQIAANTKAITEFNDNKLLFDNNKWAYDNYNTKMVQDGWIAYDNGEGSSGYYKRSGGHYENRDDGEGGVYRAYVADVQSYDPASDSWISSIKYDYNAPSQQSFADAANAAATKANAAAETANATGAAANKIYTENKDMFDSVAAASKAIDTKMGTLTEIRDAVSSPNGSNLASKLKDAADEYQKKYDAWSKTKDASDATAENYTKALAAVATRDATIDALNTGAITVSSKDADGNWKLSNGMTLTNQGKFIQDGQQLFANAAGIPQKVMDFRAADGSNVDFNENAGRVMSETDVANICKRDYGFTPSAAEIKNLAGATYSPLGNNDINLLANQKARDTYFAVIGKEPTDDQIKTAVKSGNVLGTAADLAINGLDLPANYVSPGASVDQKISFGQAYAAARSAYGNGATFEWNGKQYTTENKEEQTKRFDTYINDAQNRINLMPANDVAGAGRGFLGGKPAGAENIYYGKKDDNVYVDTRTFDAMGNVTGGSLQLADDKTATNIRATNILSQMAATGAQGIGELMQNYANAVALATGSDLNNTTYKLGKAIEQWGQDRDGEDVTAQAANIKAAIEKAGKTGNVFDQMSIIAKAAKDNPLGFISDIGKEVVQEGPGWALGAVAGGVMLTFGAGAGAVALTAAGISASLDALESFGSGGREAYDALKKAGVPEDVAREKAMINGAIHAAVTAPAEFIADKALFKAYLSGVSGGVKEYAAKYGSTIATNSLQEIIEATPQNMSTQYVTTGKADIKSAFAGAFYEGMIGGGTVTTMAGPAAINDAVIVAKDYAGKDVSLKELMDGTRDVNLSTVDSSAEIGKTTNGGSLTLGAVTAAGVENGFTTDQIKTFLPSTVTDYSTVVYKGADGTPITLGNIDSIVKKNPSLDFSKVMDTVYSTPSAEFSTVFNSSVLNGSSTLKSATDYEATARAAGFPTYAVYKQYGGDSALYQTAQNNNLATAAGFPDYATYIKFNGDKTAYNASKVATTTTTGDTTTTGATTTGTTGNTTTTGGSTATTGGTTTGGTTTTTGGATTGGATTGGTTTTGGTATTGGTTTGTTTTGGATTGTTTGGATTGTTTGGTTGGTTTGTTTGGATTGTTTGTTTGGTTTTTGGTTTTTGGVTMDSVTQAINTAIAGIKLPAGVSMDSVVTAIKNFAALNPTLSAADVTAAVKDYMTANPSITTADVNTAVTNATKGLATKADIATAIAGIKLPAGITSADVTKAIEDYMSKNSGLSAADVTSAVATYMTNHPGLAAADVKTAITDATKDFATKKDIETAISGIKLPAGITAADVATQIDAAMKANPGLTAADVTKSITDYMTAHPAITAADVTKVVDTSIATATKNLVTTDAMTKALGTVSADVKTKFDALTEGQKDIVKSQVQLGVDLNKAIDTAAQKTSEQIGQVKTDLTTKIGDVQTQFNARVDELVLQGKTYQEATQAALKELGTGVSGLQTSVTDMQEQQKAAALDAKRAANTSNTSRNLAGALSMIASSLGAGLVDDSIPGYKDIGLKNTGDAKFESILSPFQQMVEKNTYAPKPQQQPEQQNQQQLQQAAPVNQELDPQKDQQGESNYFNYGNSTEIDQMLGGNPGTQMLYSKAGGLATPLMAGGGSTRYGRYAGGGLPIVEHSGKARVDFRHGDAVTGPGDGQSDDIPAMLADGEFVFPADVVAALGNGSTKAGSDKLYDMMHSIRAYHRSAKPQDLPPPAKKSPLDYLKKPARKVRR